MHEIHLLPRPTAGFRDVLSHADHARLDAALDDLRRAVGGARLWNVNSTSQGGGVAEMLSSLLPYAAGAGIAVRWMVVDGDDRFFEVTKRIHNRLHDDPGDEGPLGPTERARYDRTLATEGEALQALVEPGDVVVLHDPQTAGLAPRLVAHGARVAWRCHVGIDAPSGLARSAWDFLRDHVVQASRLVFTRHAYVWDGLPPDRVEVVAPCIDVLSPKSQPLDDATRDAILQAGGLLDGAAGDGAGGDDVDPAYRVDGRRHLVRRRAAVVEEAPLPPDARLVVQVSRWDRLKDPTGLVSAFADHGPGRHDRPGAAHLVVAGPAVDGVSDDPESAATFAEVRKRWHDLAPGPRGRVHLACIPMDDLDENAAIVNALQRRADVIVQKSRAEGFGLTVAEAMWKRRPTVASRVGGVQDQIVHGESGILVDDPDDLPAFGRALDDLLADDAHRARLGDAAHRRVCDRYLPLHHFAAEAALVTALSPTR
jgi:trehalose synthase